MRREQPASQPARVAPGTGAALCLLLLALAGCTTLGGHGGPPAPAGPDGAATQGALLAGHLDALQHLVQDPPPEQATLLSTAQKDFENNPTPARQLRYALMLATPGHAGSNLAKAAQLLQPLASATGALSPGEQALAILQLQDVERALAQDSDNQRLQGMVDRNERDRFVANSRRLQAELDENAKLRKDLEEARAKLDAIANIERGLAKPAP